MQRSIPKRLVRVLRPAPTLLLLKGDVAGRSKIGVQGEDGNLPWGRALLDDGADGMGEGARLGVDGEVELARVVTGGHGVSVQ